MLGGNKGISSHLSDEPQFFKFKRLKSLKFFYLYLIANTLPNLYADIFLD